MLTCQIIGNLGSDPEMRYSAGGSPFLRFNVAANQRVKTADGWEDKTEWVRVTIFGPRAESLSRHLRKGDRVYVTGRLEAHPWTAQDGSIRAGLEAIGEAVEFMSSRHETERPAPASSAPARRMPEGVAVHGRPPARSAAAILDRPDEGDIDELPF